MKLKSLQLKGYAGISQDPNRMVKLESLGRFNILIGPNNSGKSTIIRFLIDLASWMGQGVESLEFGIPDNSFWKHDRNLQIQARITVDGFEDDSVAKSQYIVRHPGDINIDCTVADRRVSFSPVFYKHQTHETTKEEVQKLLNQTPQLAGGLPKWFKAFCSSFIESIVFFDAVRALDRAGGKPLAEDGSKFLTSLFAFSSDASRAIEWRKFKDKLMSRVNDVFIHSRMPPISDIEMKHGPIMHLHFTTLPDVPVPIEKMGTGVAQLLIILSLLIEREGKPTIVCVEEPESNLHPLMLRRFVDQLRTFPHTQFIFTSHSHVLLDCLTDEDRVFRLQQTTDGSCGLEACDGIQKQHSLLDALGIRASSLLQTNCVIWVEGPSDRLYIRQWLTEAAPDLQEGRDFTFNYYGGTLLAHLELNTHDQRSNDFVSMLWISRFAIVVMDRDLAPGEPETELTRRKKPIIESADEDKTHRLAIVTNGRDIENDIPKELLLKASSEIIGCDYNKIKDADIQGIKGFEHEIVAALGESDPDVIAKATRKLSEKVKIAMKVIGLCDDQTVKLVPPPYVAEMVRLIRQSETIELVKAPFA